MPTKLDILREQTHKDDGVETGRRVFYTLTDDEKLAAHRQAKLLGLLVQLLEDRGVINETDIDELLFECIH